MNVIKNTSNVDNKKTHVDEKGYSRFIDSNIYVHRWVAEKFVVKRKLYDWEVVHHRDGNKTNNQPYNLQHVTINK